ncbi:hypothetical protein L198_00248 [Cryptococcus wingfieldii CBS 7118]|uniref:BRCA2 OB1 domain-containing protein n=1 Tax=Cryptococcus wingfieldii CBS 7118 TaxID=1295528 RepID=A0A1E3K5R7_9TREE|nr:hypothetical protein L198_00248 [Cryptococcus wingfieldii CBS 7118]ODO08518.1 hypothetical protein L198_00248 [Cryptococcus wingfieldii CBS 7118]
MDPDAIQDLLRGITEEHLLDPSSDPPPPSSPSLPTLPPSSPPVDQDGPPSKRMRLDLDRHLISTPSASSSGFQTAGGRAVPPPSAASRLKAMKMFDEIDSAADPLLSATSPPEPVPLVGFTTGRGKKVPPPSAAAQQRAMKLFDEINSTAVPDAVTALPMLPETGVGPQKSEERHTPPATAVQRSPEISVDTGTLINLVTSVPTALDTPSADLFVGFKTGGGKAVPPPSAAARQRASKLFDEIESSTDLLCSTPLPNSPGLQTGFKTGRGFAVPDPSAAAKQKAYKLFEDLDSPSQLLDASGQAKSGFKMGRREEVPEPSLAARHVLKHTQSLLPKLDTDSPVPPAFRSPAPKSGTHLRSGHDISVSLVGDAENVASPTPATPALEPFKKRNTNLQPATPTRTPLSAKTNTYASTKKPIQIRTPASQVQARRIGLGSTPARKSKRGFVTPFRATPAPFKEVATPSKPKAVVSNPVFDLMRPESRLSLKQAFLHPQYYSRNELATMNIPDEIAAVTPDNAALYHFALDQSTFGTQQALKAIRECGCSLATSRWVENHWTLILWKLAGLVQAKPELYEDMWNAEEVTKQLQYSRYEREFGAAQRPLIRRIQEHDSSPSLPIVLVVSAVHRSTEDASHISLDLTDGWYHIRAQIDDCLRRAVEKGRICVGRKLAVTGAKLESGSDGAEVLDAYKSSRLIVSGNSTSLARWDTRLGMQPHPFIASLSSLTVDGGVVTLMDVVVEKVFPMAFTSGDRTSREPPWDEEEEQCRQDQWKKQYKAERGRQEEKLRKEMDKLQNLGAMLAGYAEETNPTISEAPDSIEDDLEELLGCKDAPLRIRKLASDHIVHLALCARSRLNQELEEGRSEIEAQLRTTCPPREVRDFRIVRFKDAQEVQRESFRTGMLNVWDARGLGEGKLKEGGRYLASLVPRFRDHY